MDKNPTGSNRGEQLEPKRLTLIAILRGATSVLIIVYRVRNTTGDVIATQVQLLSNCISCLESEIQHHLIQSASAFTSVSAKLCISTFCISSSFDWCGLELQSHRLAVNPTRDAFKSAFALLLHTYHLFLQQQSQ